MAAILSQLLIQPADGRGRHTAIELLLRTPVLLKVIREGKFELLLSPPKDAWPHAHLTIRI